MAERVKSERRHVAHIVRICAAVFLVVSRVLRVVVGSVVAGSMCVEAVWGIGWRPAIYLGVCGVAFGDIGAPWGVEPRSALTPLSGAVRGLSHFTWHHLEGPAWPFWRPAGLLIVFLGERLFWRPAVY